MPMEIYWFKAPEDSRLDIWKMSDEGEMLYIRADVADYIIQEEPAAKAALAC